MPVKRFAGMMRHEGMWFTAPLLLSSLSIATGAFGTIFSIQRGAAVDIFAGVGPSPAFYLGGAGSSVGFAAVSLQMNTLIGPSAGVQITPHVVSSTPSHALLPMPHGTAFVASSSSYFGVTGFLNSDSVSYQGGKVATLDFGDADAAAAARIDHSSARTAIEMPGVLLGWSDRAGPATVLVAESDGGAEIHAFAAAQEVDRIELVWAKPPTFFSVPALGDSVVLLESGLALSVRVTAESGGRTRMRIQSASSGSGCAGHAAPLPVTEELAVPPTYGDILRPSDVVSASVVSTGGGCQGVGLDTVVVFAQRSEPWPSSEKREPPFSSCA